MSGWRARRNGLLVLVALVALACGGGADERSGEAGNEEMPAAEAATQRAGTQEMETARGSEAAAEGKMSEMAADERVEEGTGTETAGQEGSESAGQAAEAGRPGAVAPAPDQDAQMPKRLKNWMMLEFSDPVTEADLDWLTSVGFRVDTVMGDRMVRGWLEKAEGAEKLTGDERIARIHTQMR